MLSLTSMIPKTKRNGQEERHNEGGGQGWRRLIESPTQLSQLAQEEEDEDQDF